MPTLNKKLLLRLLAAVLVLGGGLFALHRVQAGRVPDALLWQANAAADKGKTDKAIFYMRQYLEFRPDDHDTAIKLADLMLERAVTFKDLTNAHFLYERVLREAPNRHDVGRKLVPLCIRLGRPADALIHADRLLREYPRDGELLGQIAECQVAQNRPAEARVTFEQAITHGPDNVRAHELYARLLNRHFNQPKEARAVLDRMTAANPGQPDAFLIRARYLKADEKTDEALRDLDRVFRLDPDNAEALVMSAELLQTKGDLRRARETLRDAVALYPRDSRGYRALSWLELLSGNQADARTTLERGIVALPDTPELLTPLADIWIEQNELDKVAGAIQKLEARKDAGARVNYLRGRLLMKQGQWSEAFAVLDALRTEATGQPALAAQLNLLIAGCNERRGDRDAQVEALKRVLTIDPNHLGARVALANAYLTAGRIEDAIKEYQTATRSPYAGLGVVTTYLNLRLAFARMSDAAPAEWQAIVALLGKIRQQYPQAVEPIVLLADAFAGRGDFAAAAKLLREETSKRPDDPRLWTALATHLSRGQGTLAAAGAVAEGQIATGESIDVRLARARIWADDPQPGREQRIARMEEMPAGLGDAERNRLLGGLADLYAMIRDEVGQKRVLAEFAGRNASDLGSRKALYSLALKDNDSVAQTRWRAEIRRLDKPNRIVAILDGLHQVATATADDKRMAEWQELLRATLAATPDFVEAQLFAAKMAELRGDKDVAAKHLETAVALDVTALKPQEARLAYYLRAGQDEPARRTLARLESDPRITSQRFRAIVEGATSQVDGEAFGKCLSWLTASLKREPRLAVWAGRQLESRGKVSDAMSLYRQATDAAPAFADAWSARLVAASRIGETDVAEVMTQGAKALEKKAFFAVCAESGSAVRMRVPSWAPPIETADDQRSYATACIAACEARGRLEDALPVLAAIAASKDARKEDADWAKQTIAALTAALGSSDKKADAIATLRHGDKPANPEDARARVNALSVVLKSAGGDDRRAIVRDMIGLLRDVIRDPAATSNDWFQLAQLFRVVGDRTNCRKCLEELTKREPNNLLYAAVRIDDLLGEGRLEEAAPLVERIASGAADIRVTAAAGRFYTLTNQPRPLLDLVEKFVRAVDPGTADAAGRQRQSAELLDQLSRIAASRSLSGYKQLLDGACERHRASLRAYPEAVIPMAALLAFDGQVQPAFDELEKLKARLSPTALATAGVAVLRGGHADQRQFQTVKKWIEDALKDTPDVLALKLNLGELHTLRQDFATAEQVYRDVLKSEPKNIVALNNLAWILAPRPESADQALVYADRAIELYGATGEMLDTRARILISAGKFDRALADLNDAINQSQTPLRYFHLAVAQWKMSKPDDAVKTFKEARARGLDAKGIHPHDLPTYKALATKAGS